MQAASARLIGKARSLLFTTGSMACPSHEGRWALRSRMTLSSAWKGRTRVKKRSEEVGESTWKKSTTQAGPVWHLTSWSSGRLRAAHVGAAHQRVRCQNRKPSCGNLSKYIGLECRPAWLKRQGASPFVLLAKRLSTEEAFPRIGALLVQCTATKSQGFRISIERCGSSSCKPPRRA